MDTFDEKKLTLGTRVKYSKRMERKLDRTNSQLRREWQRVPTYHRDAWRAYPQARSGIIVGKRKYANGTISYGDYGPEFCADGYVDVYLVSWNMRQKPDPVLLSDLEFEDVGHN